MTVFSSFIQGMIQGLSEFLPISSSGHLSLYQHFTGQSGEVGALFAVLLHAGTLLAVCIAFWRTLLDMIVAFFQIVGDVVHRRFRLASATPTQRMVLLVLVSLLPLCGFVFLSDWYSSLAADSDIIVEGVCFLLTSMLLFLADSIVPGRKRAGTMRFSDALIVGTVQGIAPLPGLSRSGSTISAGMLCGLEKQYAVSFSFIMGIPAVIGANLKEGLELIGQPVSLEPLPLIVGVASAAVFGLLAIRMVRWLTERNKFKIFGIYTLILGVATVGVGIYELATGRPVVLF